MNDLLEEIDCRDIGDKVRISKEWIRSAEFEPSYDFFKSTRVRVSELAPDDATHFAFFTEEVFFWGKTRYVSEIHFFKEK